jgi:hypothetical protein
MTTTELESTLETRPIEELAALNGLPGSSVWWKSTVAAMTAIQKSSG